VARKNQEPYVLLSQYEKLYLSKYGVKPRINKYRDKWGMESMIDDLGVEKARIVLDLYFKTVSSDRHSLSFLYNNYDKIVTFSVIKEKDAERRRAILEETRKRVENEQ